MNLVLFSLFAGINIAFAILSFFIYSRNKGQSMYLYFGGFSLFSGFYFLLQSISGALEIDLRTGIIFCAAVYYGLFPWFIFEFVQMKIPKGLLFIPVIFLIAFLVLMFYPENGRVASWQIIAHIGLTGLIICVIYASIHYEKQKRAGSLQFVLISFLFVFLALEEMTSNYLRFGLPKGDPMIMPPLDIYPLLFTMVIGFRLSKDFVNRKRMELQTVKHDLNEKRLKVIDLERLRLLDEVNFKKRDLTDFGIEITRKREFIKELLFELNMLKKEPNIRSVDLDKIVKHTRSQMKIDEHLDFFHRNVELINHEFNDKLKESYPSLTENELHLSSLLRLKLNTKEIAKIKNISPDSVKVLRYRLRKKFSLTKEMNLVEFLQRF